MGEITVSIIVPVYKVERFIERCMRSLLEQTLQSVEYIVVNEYGPSHDKTFEVEARVDGMLYGSGIGKSKKEAEQNAARDAIKKSSGGIK